MNLDQVKQELLQAQSELEARLARTHKHIYQKDEPVSPNFNEQIKQTENDALVRALDEEAQEELRAIGRALNRIEAGTYLQCVNCGRQIGEQRLKAVPYADLCIKCASTG